MSNITRITLPVSNTVRLKNVKDGSEKGLWVAAGPSPEVAAAIEAGGVHLMTRYGPRVVLVDRVVKLGDGTLAIVPIEPDFEAAKNVTTTTAAIEDLSVEQLKAALAAAQSKGAGAKVTSSGRNGGRKGASAKPAASKPATVVQSAPAATAVEDVNDDDLADLLVTS